MSRALRILVAHNVRCDRPGGMSRIMERIHGFVERAGHTVDYLCAEDAGAAAHGWRARFLFPWIVRRRVVSAQRGGIPYDIVNVHEPSGAALTATRRARGPQVVVTSHGVERRAWELALEEARLGRAGPGLKTRLVYPITSLAQSDYALRHADQVFCLNEQDREYLQRRYGVAAASILRIFPGAEPAYAEAAATRSYSANTRLLVAGTWRKNKGIEDLVPAFAQLAARFPTLTLTVAGAGASDAEVRSHFPAGVRDRVSTRATSTDAETAGVFAEHHVYLLPSLFEGTPLTLMEAMMSGLPIVTTDTCGMRDVIEHDRTGLLVPIRSPDAIVSAVARLLDQPGDRERLGRAAHATAQRLYTWDRVAQPVLETYERLAMPS